MQPAPHPLGPWRITHADLHVELDPAAVTVSSRLHVEPVDGAEPGPLVLDGRGLTTRAVQLDGADLATDAYELTDRTLTLHLADGAHVVGTTVTAPVGAPHTKGFVQGPTLLFTDCEPEGFRRITWFLDRPSNRSTFEVTLVADPDVFPVTLTNGNKLDEGQQPDGRRWVRFHDPFDKPSYLFSMVAGNLAWIDRPFRSASGRDLTLRVASGPGTVSGTRFASEMLEHVMRFDEQQGGIEHDLDTLTYVAVPGYSDATEYHGLMFFEPSLLVVDHRGWVDDDLLLISANVAHEYGHHVRGNRVTVASWDQLALKEGLTVLMGQNDFRRHWLGHSARVMDVLDLRRLQFPEEVTIGAPVVRSEVGDPASLYTRTTYLKGAEIFGMLRTVLGPERWAATFAAFIAEHDLGSATIDQFMDAAFAVAPDAADDLDGVARWFGLVGRPAVRIDTAPGSVRLSRTDALRDDPPVAMPVVLGFRADDGTPLEVSLDGGAPAAQHTVVLRGREQSVQVDAPRPFVLSPLRGYSAPVDLAVDLDDGHLAVLLRHDDDAFARWWAGEELMIRVVDAHRASRAAEARTTLDVLADALGHVAGSETDPLLLANLLALPDEFMLGDRDAQIDVDGVAEGLSFLREHLGLALHDPLLAVLDRFGDDHPGGDTARDITIRMLVEPVLALLLATGSAEGGEAALAQLGSADSTRAVRALTQLAHYDDVPFDDLLRVTYESWQHSPKLIDRWLRAQSGSRRSDTIERVKALAAGPLYDRDDRARVMGVWFPFATRNRAVFHHPSGEGYRAFVDELGMLMPTNAGLAVRLAGDLLQFKRFDAHRRALLRAELERMTEMPGMPDFAVGIVRSLLA
ncbi:MAG: aminopeptidase [Actinomycetota bacterium]|jgi:aminopeptidase N